MSNPTGYKGSAWTAGEEAQLRALMKTGTSRKAMAIAIGRSVGSIEGKVAALRTYDRIGRPDGEFVARYETPETIASDDGKHLRLIAKANPRGFGWWPNAIMDEVYKLEASFRGLREFWRAS